MRRTVVFALLISAAFATATRTTEMPEGDELVNPPDSTRTFSSIWSGDAKGAGHGRSMINSPQAWSTASKSTGDTLIIDVGSEKCITGIATQGRVGNTSYQRVTKVSVDVSSDNSEWTRIPGGQMTANKNGEAADLIVYNIFGSPKDGRYVKITIEAYHGWPSMRAGVVVSDDEYCGCIPRIPSKNNVATLLGISEEDVCELVGTHAAGCHIFCDVYDDMPDPEGLCPCAEFADVEEYECQQLVAYCDNSDGLIREICPYTCCHFDEGR